MKDNEELQLYDEENVIKIKTLQEKIGVNLAAFVVFLVLGILAYLFFKKFVANNVNAAFTEDTIFSTIGTLLTHGMFEGISYLLLFLSFVFLVLFIVRIVTLKVLVSRLGHKSINIEFEPYNQQEDSEEKYYIIKKNVK